MPVDPIVSRRDFVKTSAAVAAGGVALGALTRSSAARSVFAADDPIKVALVGCGGRGCGAALDAIGADRGAIICRMGKAARSTEADAQERALLQMSVPILGRIEPPGTLEGGDVFWVDERTLAVGRGYRTNDEGIRQLRLLLGDSVDELIVVPLPHWRGPGDVMHLMSLVSPVDRDLAVVYSPLLPVPFRERLLDRGITLVEVPDREFKTMGTNVLAVKPRVCIALDGNIITRQRLQAAGATVIGYDGGEISVKGSGGPTCLTRPLSRRKVD